MFNPSPYSPGRPRSRTGIKMPRTGKAIREHGSRDVCFRAASPPSSGARRRAHSWVCEVPIRYRVEYDVVRWFDVEPSEQQQGCPNPPSGVIERTCGRGTVVGRRKEFIYELVAEPMDCDGWRGNADGAER